jgi:hypothetical protein
MTELKDSRRAVGEIVVFLEGLKGFWMRFLLSFMICDK